MRLWLRMLVCSASVFVGFSCAADKEPVVRAEIADQYRPLAFDEQRLSGLLAERMRANVEGYLEKAGSEEQTAQSIGQYLDAAANAYDYTHDPNLGAAMHEAVQAAQQRQPQNAAAAGQLLLGLLSYYRVTGDEGALTTCKKLGDDLLPTPLEASSLEPLISLYSFTGDRRYLEHCRKLVQSYFGTPNAGASVSASDISQELSGMLGVAAFYRVTGDSSYLKLATAAWRQIHTSHLTITGTVANTAGHAETACITLAWMRLTLQLLRLTGQPQYGDELERTVYNQLLASQDGRTGNVFTRVPLDGAKEIQPAGSCRNSVSVGISIIPALIWGRYSNGLAINFYTSGSAAITLRGRRDMRLSHRTVPHLYRGNVHLYEEANFPENGTILLHVEPDYSFRFPLRLRVPAWTNHFELKIGATHLKGRPGEYVLLNRKWERGDTVEISMGMPVRYIASGASGKTGVALQRGPQILCVSKALNPKIDDLSGLSLPAPSVSQLSFGNDAALLPNGWSGDQAYRIGGPSAQQPLTFVPFADARVCQTTFPTPVAH